MTTNIAIIAALLSVFLGLQALRHVLRGRS